MPSISHGSSPAACGAGAAQSSSPPTKSSAGRSAIAMSAPGARLPHVWLDGHVALQDRLGPGYTLLRLGATGEDASALQRSFAAYDAPFDVLDVADDAARDVYGYDLILLRPDLHIVWRGNRLPIEPDGLAAIATGHL